MESWSASRRSRSASTDILYDSRALTAPAWSNATPTPITVPVEEVHNGSMTAATTVPHPFLVTNRFYHIRVRLPGIQP